MKLRRSRRNLVRVPTIEKKEKVDGVTSGGERGKLVKRWRDGDGQNRPDLYLNTIRIFSVFCGL